MSASVLILWKREPCICKFNKEDPFVPKSMHWRINIARRRYFGVHIGGAQPLKTIESNRIEYKPKLRDKTVLADHVEQ